jgi:hypothetical protein
MMDCSHFCSTCTFYSSFLHFCLHSFFISYPTVFLFFVLFGVSLFYLLSRSVYFMSCTLFFFIHSHFLLTHFLFLLMCFPLSSFLYLFNLVSISQSLSFELRLPESIRVLEACEVSSDRSLWISRLPLFPRMHAWSMTEGLLNLWTLHECGDVPT